MYTFPTKQKCILNRGVSGSDVIEEDLTVEAQSSIS